MSDDFCARKIQIGEERWTDEDEKLEFWLKLHGMTYTFCVDYREDAKSEEEWRRYVDDVKAFALQCKSNRDFMDLRKHVKGLVPVAPSHDIRDKNGKLIAIID